MSSTGTFNDITHPSCGRTPCSLGKEPGSPIFTEFLARQGNAREKGMISRRTIEIS